MGERGTRLSLKNAISGLFELAGFAAVVAGCFQIALWLGLIVLGIVLLAIGVAINPIKREDQSKASVSPLHVVDQGADFL